MTRHLIATESKCFRDRGPHLDGQWRFRSTCACGWRAPDWTSEGMAAGHASRHLFAVKAALR